MKTKHQIKHLDSVHRFRGRRRTVLAGPSMCLQEIAYNDGRTEKKGTIPTIREKIPGWTDEELLGLALVLSEDEEERENYTLNRKARGRLHSVLEI